MKASCTWGEGPDVILDLDGSLMVLYENPHDKEAWTHGAISDGSLDLTAAEAEELGIQLITASKQARDLSKSAQEYFDGEETRPNQE
jgi:hypothetical protein